MIWLIGFAFLFLVVILIGLILKISTQVSDRLNQMNQSLQEAHKIIGQNLGNATTGFGSVGEKLGKLEAPNRQI